MNRDDRLEDLSDKELVNLIKEEIRHREGYTRDRAIAATAGVRYALSGTDGYHFRRALWCLDSAIEEAEARLSPKDYYAITNPLREAKHEITDVTAEEA